MNETLYDLEQKRSAVELDIQALYETLQKELDEQKRYEGFLFSLISFYYNVVILVMKFFIIFALNTLYAIHAPKTFKITSSISHEPVNKTNCNISIKITIINIVIINFLNDLYLSNNRGKKNAKGTKATMFPNTFVIVVVIAISELIKAP